MRILVLGGTGMLGHKVVEVLGVRHEMWGTHRGRGALPPDVSRRLGRAEMLGEVNAADWPTVEAAIGRARPDAVVNCVGIVKQAAAAKDDPIQCIEINALFPHVLSLHCASRGVRLVHLSTDCVFSGRARHYTEDDMPDPPDLYGRSKLLGEIEHNGLTIRTSIIGRGLRTRFGLIDWFLDNRGQTVRGYTRAIFSGLPTVTLAGVIGRLLEAPVMLDGVYHVASEPISKFDLLVRLRDALGLNIAVEPSADLVCDRSLVAGRFEKATGYAARGCDDLTAELVADVRTYDS